MTLMKVPHTTAEQLTKTVDVFTVTRNTHAQKFTI